MRKVVFIICCIFNMMIIHGTDKVTVSLNKCIDGDTAKFVIDGSVKTVRFLSINTPEIAHDGKEAEFYGDEASRYTCDILEKANKIVLEFDPKSDKTDKYGRILAWVFVDDMLLQDDLVRGGYAEVKYVYDDYLYSSMLIEVQELAKQNEVGIWSNNMSNSFPFEYFYIGILVGILFVFAFYNKRR